MAQQNRDDVLEMIFGHEKGYSDHPDDPGGATNWGITIKTLTAWRRRKNPGAVVTKDDVRALTKREAWDILSSQYLDPILFDELPSGLDYSVADFSVNSGPSTATRKLQTIVGVEPDGQLGGKTLEAVKKFNTVDLIRKYNDSRMSYLKSLKNWGSFSRGWTIRVTGIDPKGKYAPAPGVLGQSIKMAQSPGTVAVSSVPTNLPKEVVEQVQAKAPVTDTKTSSTPGFVEKATTIASAVGAAASDAAGQLTGYTEVSSIVKYIFIALTVTAAVATLIKTVSSIRTQGTVTP